MVPSAPIVASRLTEQQQTFVQAVAFGRDKTDAALEAGYSEVNATQYANFLLRQPNILAAVQIAIARELANAAPMALKLLRDTASNTEADPRLRVVCAKTILDRAGHIAPKAAAPGAAGVLPLNEMSMDDLRALADNLEGELAGRAKEVSSATAAPRKAQTIEDII